MEGEDWDLDGSCPFLCRWTYQLAIDAACVDVADVEPAVGELAYWPVDSSP